MLLSINSGSELDLKLVKNLEAKLSTLPVVEELRGTTGSEEINWEEVRVMYEEGNTMVNQSMSGYPKLGAAKAFWNQSRRELGMVTWYGASLCGWPTMVHGGATATVFIEGMGRAVNCLTGGMSSVETRLMLVCIY